MCLVQTRHENSSFIIYVAFFEDNCIFVDNLILHPDHNSLFLETITIKFREPRGRGVEGRGPTYGAGGRGPRKTNTRISKQY